MKKNIRFGLVALFLVSLISNAQNIITDGGFEYTDSPTNHGWSLFYGTVTYVTVADATAPEGSRVLDEVSGSRSQGIQYNLWTACTNPQVSFYVKSSAGCDAYLKVICEDDTEIEIFYYFQNGSNTWSNNDLSIYLGAGFCDGTWKNFNRNLNNDLAPYYSSPVETIGRIVFKGTGRWDALSIAPAGTPSPTIALSPSSLSFSATEGGSNPSSQIFTVNNSGGGTLSWTATESASWMTLNPTSGSAGQSCTVSIQISGLSAGTYNQNITISASGATNTPQQLPVALTINAASSGVWQSSGSSIYYNGGNVGINTSTPDNKLDVNGIIRATEIKVETGWSDFVFSPGYRLPTLNEVESFIRINRHLPDMPSEKEVEANGVCIGDTQSRLLRKIEELTLYIIEQQKVIEKQQESIEFLIEKIENLNANR